MANGDRDHSVHTATSVTANGTAARKAPPRRRPRATLWKRATDRLPALAWIPKHWRGLVGVFAVGVPLIAGVATFLDKLTNVWWQWYGPDVVLGVLPKAPIPDAYGASDLVNEYIFRRDIAREVRNDQVLLNLFSAQRPTTIQPFRCPSAGAPEEPDVYKITTVSQNLGHRPAEKYQATITFASGDRSARDPGVRILHVGVDDLRVSYVYQQEASRRRPDCLPKMEGNWNVSQVVRQTYQDLGLTRDMVILTGNLPAQVFQTVDIIAYIPCSTRPFAAIFQVQCPNCWLSYRMTSLAQVLQLPNGCAKNGAATS